MNCFQDAFISYGRADSKAFASKLNDRLTQQGLEVWFDFDDIPLGVDYQNQIDDGIEKADNFVYLISPHSVNSPYCAKEVQLALKRHKRIIPILHVEQISRETWQQRFPKGTDAEWQDYVSKGLHSSFPNMHPEIAKINWVYFREGVDDFETSFNRLLEIFERHKSYAHQHTYFLSKALEWDRNQRQTRYLLVGEERQKAEEWLQYRFQEEQPPSTPTDLHCEFITESTKNANNLMTQVFLSWATEDRAFMERVRQVLLRECFTLWVSNTDIQTGADFQTMINRGVEEADNIVYLISPAALKSVYCQQEITYAQSLNKRIVPLLIAPIDLEQLPPGQRSLQFIDFSDNTTEEENQRDFAKLIRILREEAAHYEAHKVLLTKALKWDRQNRNPSILLRGYNLSHAEAWLKVAKRQDQHPPIPLIEEFITESLRQPIGLALDVFLSYSRKDSEFARRLNDALQVQGKTTWFDQESIAAGTADFKEEIYKGIESSNHFLFVISPHSIESPYCADEVEYAAKLNKRIITVLSQPTNPANLPAALASVQWIDFTQRSNFESNFSVLLRTLDNDPEYLRTHTWLLLRALEWDEKNRDEALLLRGNTLKEVRDWLLASEGKTPIATVLQRDYVTASNGAEIRRHRTALRLQRIAMAVVSSISLVAVSLGAVAFKASKDSDQSKQAARREEILAKTRTSEAMFESNQVLNALLESMEAGIQLRQEGLEGSDLRAPVVTALQQAVFWVREQQRIAGHEGIIWSVAVSPDGRYIASASGDATVRIWQQNGALVQTLTGDREAQKFVVTFSPDGKQIAAANADGRIYFWEMNTWKRNAIAAHPEAITSLAFSPDGRVLASASEDGTVRLWGPDHKRIKTLERHNAAVRSVSFSPDGKLIATASDDGIVRLWTAQGVPVKTLVGHTAQVRSVRFSPDSQLLVSGSWDETIRVWRRDGSEVETIRGHETLIHDAQFSPDGKTIASAGWDKTIRIWTLDGRLISTLAGHTAQVRSIAFNPDKASNTLVSTGGDRTVRIWQLRRPLLATLQDHRARVYGATFSPNGKLLASAGADNTVRLWTAQGQPLRQLVGHEGVVWSVNFSPDSKKLVSASSDYALKLWNSDGKLLNTLIGHQGPVHSAEFSPDGKMIVSGSADRTVRLWRSDGKPIRTVQTLNTGVLTVHFSPDGRTIATSGWDNQVRLWTLNGQLITTLGGKAGHQGWVYDVAFSHDGQQILTGSYDNTAKLWNRDGKLITTLVGHEDGVIGVHFRRDDQVLATASHDHTVKLWRRSGELITTLRGHSDRVSDSNFSPDGKRMATASEDNTVLLWDLQSQGDLDSLLAQGCRWTENFLSTNLDAQNHWRSLQQYCRSTVQSQTHPNSQAMSAESP